MKAEFAIVAASDPSVLGRLIEFFAQRGLMPETVTALADGAWLRIKIAQPDIDPAAAEVIAEKMRSMVLVQRVRLSFASQVAQRRAA